MSSAMSHKVDRARRAQQTELPIYAETAITAFETTLWGLASASLYKYRDRESCNLTARLCLKMVCGMPSSAVGSRGIEELGEALGPLALGLLARQNIQCATTMMARRMPFMTHVVRMMIFELWRMENTLMSHKNTTCLMGSILRVFLICTLGRERRVATHSLHGPCTFSSDYVHYSAHRMSSIQPV